MSHYVDFNECFFRGDFSANEYSSDISNLFEWLRMSDSREIYVCRCLGKFTENPTYSIHILVVKVIDGGVVW